MNPSESNRKANRPFDWVDLHLVLVFTGVAILSIGVWNVGVPFGDEGIHIQQAIGLYGSGEFSSNTYFAFYVLIFRFITEDPVSAHLLFRVLSTVFSTLGLYYVLTGFSNLNRLAIAFACIWWATTHLCNPYIQSGNNNLFALSLVLPGLGLLVRWVSPARLILFVILCLLASRVRSEYLAPLILISLYGLYLMVKNNQGFVRGWFSKAALVSLAGLIATGVYLQTAKNMGAGRSLDQYLLQGLGQCWGDYYRKRHPEEVFDPYTEYQPVLDRVFGNPTGFFDAITNNPREAFTYFVINGANNLIRVVPGMLATSSPFKSLLLSIILVSCLGAMIREAWFGVKTFQGWKYLSENMRFSDSLIVLFLFTVASSAAIILLIPDVRYWISWSPIVYYYLACIFSWSLAMLKKHKLRKPALVSLIILLCFPLLWTKPGNQVLIKSVRQIGKQYGSQPVLLGILAYPLATFAFRGNAKPISVFSENTWNDLSAKKFDIFIADRLNLTSFWKTREKKFKSFFKSPELYGYLKLSPEKSNGHEIFYREAFT